jgi:zinc D-Ala-D-Ala carboxypeptidase
VSRFHIKKLNEKGFGWHFALPVVAIVAVASVGAYLLTQSHAATCKDYIYGNGGSGVCVGYIQKMLNGAYEAGTAIGQNPNFAQAVGLPVSSTKLITVDGSYGPQTVGRVKAFQTAMHQRTIDGIVGPTTWAQLCGAAYTAAVDRQNDSVAQVGWGAAQHAGCPAQTQ